MNKRHLTTAIVVLSFFCAARDARADEEFSAFLNGAQVVPAVQTNAFALAALLFVEFGSSDILFTIKLDFNFNERVDGAHIHLAPSGRNGLVVLDYLAGATISLGPLSIFVSTSGDLVGPLAGQTLDDLEEEIEDGNAYMDLHTATNPNGLVRGQIDE